MKYRPSRGNVEGIELEKQPIAFRVHVATIAGVSGFTGVFVLCDEVSKWRDTDTGVNPATEVIRSVRPTILTQPNARIVLSSSPMGTLDAHYDAFEEGETDLQIVAQAATWEANPSVTEAETHLIEPDEVVWAREYKAVPQTESERSLLSAVIVDRAMKRWAPHEPSPLFTYTAAIDPAMTRNAWTFAATTIDPDGTRIVARHEQWQGSKQRPLVARATFAEIAKLVAPLRVSHVLTDQYAVAPLRELAQGTGVSLRTEAWSQALMREAYEGLKALANEDRLVLPDDPLVKADLLGIRVKLTRQGEIYDLETRGERHSDYAPVIAMALHFTKVRARRAAKELSVQEQHLAQRDAWLSGRQRERERREKFGRLPATHRIRAKTGI